MNKPISDFQVIDYRTRRFPAECFCARVQYRFDGFLHDQVGPWALTPADAEAVAKDSVAAACWGIKGFPHTVNF